MEPWELMQLHEDRKAEWLKTRPKCGICEQAIQDDYWYLVFGRTICPTCLQEDCLIMAEE
jgi:hypothetical protein